MSVYTELNSSDFTAILADYNLGQLHDFQGIAAGIENSNYFIITDSGRYVLTIFERMQAEELPYFMRLMKHLATNGLSCPDVMARHDGSLLFETNGKQGCIVSCLSGKTLDALNMAQLRSSGESLARLHLAGADFDEHRSNPTGPEWLAGKIAEVVEKTASIYGRDAAELLTDELTSQRALDWSSLPRGVIHGDLFVDNILFDGDQASGIIDFYYAHDAAFAMDIAITLNAQAVLLGDHDQQRMDAFLSGYEKLRPLQQQEREALPLLLRLGALRFWVSRLYDAIYPRGGAMTQTKDPEEYRRKLMFHRRKA
ncbi:homoserine kinase [Mariprofundus erugo]|uniref:Homoserine kinase n=1 Tax=Mariprofundus erugo TaxID=2528639 RepID=A0A5R9GYS0_9PROT|nr:homoserine kinase [Mariprofundus erugo]TLS69163.1 homoserine kinase [Mariprofundus erugo]TLS74282.1 homoserine kinase [Mariprofundus erugo]